MISIEFIFENSGNEIYNDIVYPNLFELPYKSYTFKITPLTKFWRFGIRFSKTPKIDFYHPRERYKTPEFWDNYIDIHLGVGEWDGVQWNLPNRIYLVHYNLKGVDHVLNRQETYKELGEVEWNVIPEKDRKTITTSYKADGCQPSVISFDIPEGYNYFNVFGWADKIDFKLHAKIEIDSQTKFRTNKFKLFDKPDRSLIDTERLVEIYKDLILNSENSDEQFFALFGKWGRGKTFFFEQLKKSLVEGSAIDFFPIEFHAWKYQDTPGIWAYLYNEINSSYYKYSNPNIFIRFWRTLRLNWYRNKILKPILLLLGSLSVSTLIFILLINQLDSFKKIEFKIVSAIGVCSFSLFAIITYLKDYKNGVKQVIKDAFSKTTYKNQLGLQYEIQQELKFLLKAWVPKKNIAKKRVILFVDDIDRCSEDKIIQIVDCIRVLLHDQEIQNRMTVLAAVDERILVKSIEKKYSDFMQPEDKLSTHLCREYLDKLFIASLKLGPLIEQEKKEIWKGFTDRFVVSNKTNSHKDLVAPVVETSDEIILAEQIHSRKEVKILNIETSDNQSFIIEKWEQEYIESLFKNIELTPRSIRIYTYRYLLGKRLIEKPLNDDSAEFNEWTLEENPKKYFASLLLYFSFSNNIGQIDSAYNHFLISNSQNTEYSEKVFGYTFKLSGKLSSIIYQVLTMIVPY